MIKRFNSFGSDEKLGYVVFKGWWYLQIKRW